MKRSFEQNAQNYFRYSAVMSNTHYDCSVIFERRHRALGVIVVVFSAIVGTSLFASLTSSADWRVTFATGLLSLAAATLSALQTFFGFADLQARHKRAAAGYSMCRRQIEMLVARHPDVTSIEVPLAGLAQIVLKLDELDEQSPTVPDPVYNAAMEKTPIE
ncbi:MAG: SLATT domain-containing protein [Pseudomonadota bacterium]